MIIDNLEFTKIFNEKIFENSKLDLLKKISCYPDRYVGLFRPTKPKIKIIQNITQSHEIKFGDALEEIIEMYFIKYGFKPLDRKLICEDCEYDIDQYLEKNNNIYFIEQKVRDDHDSTKKRGQIKNFENKLAEIQKRHPSKNILAFFYFIDPSLVKNKNYYKAELESISKDYGIECQLCYGKELFEMISLPEIWDDMLKNLELWKRNLPEFPEINFDKDAQSSFDEIKELPLSDWRKILSTPKIIEEVFPVIFPENKCLSLLYNYFKDEKQKNPNMLIYDKLCNLLEKQNF